MRTIATFCAALIAVAASQGTALAQSPAPQPEPAATVQPAQPKFFGVRNIVFVTDKVAGFGQYTKRPAPVFIPGEQLKFYLEPVNLGWSSTGGSYRFNVVMDIEIRRPDGEIVAGKRGFGNIVLEATKPRDDTFINAYLTPSNLPAGTYILGIRLRDPVNNRVVEKDLAFEIIEAKRTDA